MNVTEGNGLHSSQLVTLVNIKLVTKRFINYSSNSDDIITCLT